MVKKGINGTRDPFRPKLNGIRDTQTLPFPVHLRLAITFKREIYFEKCLTALTSGKRIVVGYRTSIVKLFKIPMFHMTIRPVPSCE